MAETASGFKRLTIAKGVRSAEMPTLAAIVSKNQYSLH